MTVRLRFDRGTLVIAADVFGQLADLPYVRWDPRVEAYRAPAFQYRRLWVELRRRGFAADAHILRTHASKAEWRAVDLRPYQQAALLAWTGEQRGLIVLPTGSGKTRLACAVIAACGVPALCLVPTRALLHQWSGEIAKHYSGRVGCLGDGQHRVEAISVATFESGYRCMDRIGDRFGLLIVDEVHHFGTGVRDEALEMCAAPRRLALTATSPEGEALARVNELMGPTVCELRVADLSGLWLADFENVVLALRLTSDEQKQYDYLCSRFRVVFERFRAFNPQASWRDLSALATRSEPGRSALAAFRASRQITSFPAAKRCALASLLREHRAQRVLVFTSDNATAYAIAREHLIMPITCDIDRAERDRALAAFRSGELRVLVSAQVLNEGIDVPDAEVAIIVGGVRGPREHVQRVGRLLRPVPGKRAYVYELVMEGTHEARKAVLRRRALQQNGGQGG
jgi:superfamily II DNA or RNA helicase